VLVDEAFGGELDRQRDLMTDVGLADLAHVVAAVECDVIPRADGAALLQSLLDLQARGRDVLLDPALGDIYTNREAWLSERTAAAGWLGVGRARREAVTTGYALAIRRRALDCGRAAAGAADELARAARRYAHALMPDYTYLQAGQPTTFGHYLLAFAYPLVRDLERLQSLGERLDRSPAGVGSTNGSSLPLDRARIAELLGFGALVTHARDAMWQADLPIEVLGVACAAAVNLDRLAEDLAIFSTAEFGFVELADAHARASKAMPQKKNPYALGYVRAVANRTIGTQAGIAAAGRTPSGQMDNRLAAYGDVPQTLGAVAGAARLMGAVVARLTFDEATAYRALERNWSFASDVAELLMRAAGIDYRSAHGIVGRLHREARAQSDPVSPLTREQLCAAAEVALGRPVTISERDLAGALDPRAAIARRAAIGGASTARVEDMAHDVRARAARAAQTFEAALAAHAVSERDLLARAAELASAS
jgi:argininosuccinate lyase